MNEVAQKYRDFPIEFWTVYTSESHPEFVVESDWVIETYDARRQRARNFLWTLEYLGIPLQPKLLVDNTLSRAVWSTFPAFFSEVRAKYGGDQGAWIVDLEGRLLTTRDDRMPPIIDYILSKIFAPLPAEGGE